MIAYYVVSSRDRELVKLDAVGVKATKAMATVWKISYRPTIILCNILKALECGINNAEKMWKGVWSVTHIVHGEHRGFAQSGRSACATERTSEYDRGARRSL